MSNEKTDWWVGLFVLLGGIALAFLALRAGNLSSFSFAPTYSLTAKFDNIGGLKVRAPIKSAGVVVGRVASISLDEKTFQAVVTFQIEKNYNMWGLRSAATKSILPQAQTYNSRKAPSCSKASLVSFYIPLPKNKAPLLQLTQRTRLNPPKQFNNGQATCAFVFLFVF